MWVVRWLAIAANAGWLLFFLVMLIEEGLPWQDEKRLILATAVLTTASSLTALLVRVPPFQKDSLIGLELEARKAELRRRISQEASDISLK